MSLSEIEKELQDWLNTKKIGTNGEIYFYKRLVTTVKDLKIVIHPQDHQPIHFHVTSTQNKTNAKINIDTLDFIDGKISQHDVRIIKAYFHNNPEEYEFLKNEAQRMGLK